jgi:hypothetical protein
MFSFFSVLLNVRYFFSQFDFFIFNNGDKLHSPAVLRYKVFYPGQI